MLGLRYCGTRRSAASRLREKVVRPERTKTGKRKTVLPRFNILADRGLAASAPSCCLIANRSVRTNAIGSGEMSVLLSKYESCMDIESTVSAAVSAGPRL